MNFTHTPMLTITEQAIQFSANNAASVVAQYNDWVKKRIAWHKATPLIATRALTIHYRSFVALPTVPKSQEMTYTLLVTYEHCDVVGAAEGTNQINDAAEGYSAIGQKRR